LLAARVGFAHHPLREGHELLDLAALTLLGPEPLAPVRRRLARDVERVRALEVLAQQLRQAGVAAGADAVVAIPQQCQVPRQPGAAHLRLHGVPGRCREFAWSRAPTVVARGRWATDARPLAPLDLQHPRRREQPGNLAVPELAQQAPDVAVDRLAPHALARPERADDHGIADAGVEGSAVQGHDAAFAVADDADVWVVLFAREPVHRRQHLLHFAPEECPAHLEGHAVDELAVRLVGQTAELRVARPGVAAVDQRGDEDAGAVLGQAAGVLGVVRDSGGHPDEHLRRFVRIGQRHEAGRGLARRL
jgi:hypothetical protein